MNKELIKCPECGAEFELSQAISHDIEITIAKKYEKQIKELKDKFCQDLDYKEKELAEKFKHDQKHLEEKAKKEAEESLRLELSEVRNELAEKTKKLDEVQKKEIDIIKKQREIQDRERSLEVEMAKKIDIKEKELRTHLEIERKTIEEKAEKRAEESMRLEFADLKEQFEEKSKKLKESQQMELELRKRQRELEQKEKSLEIEVARIIDVERQRILEEALRDYEEKHHLKDAEKEKQLTDMKKQIDELKRKAEQGSQKSQGEVLEIELEDMLKNEFPFDEIEPVPTGIKGADAIQIVKSQSGKVCGKILWETKRTKTWSDLWLQKLKDDQQEAKADIAVLVSEILPKGLTHFRMIKGIWVTAIPSSLSLALALRVVLTQVAREKQLQSGKQEKMELVYNYLTGPEFRNRVEAIIESFIAMKSDLDAEKRAMSKIWDKRQKQIERVIYNIGGMHGDLEGIAGMTLPTIKTLELPTIQIREGEKEIDDESFK